MKRELKEIIKKDVFRLYGKYDLSMKQRILMPIELKYIINFRKAQFYSENRILSVYYRLKLRRLSMKSLIQIPYKTQIGEGFYIGHFGRIIINDKAKLGENVNIATGVTIGQTNRGAKKGYPTIGSEVWIGSNSVIVGGINIGDDVLIAPNAYVNFDVPSHSIVIGNPAVIHYRKSACEEYINNKI